MDVVEDATYNYYVLGDGSGTHGFESNNYYTLEEFDSFLDMKLSTVADTGTFLGGTAYGGVMQFTVVPEPGTFGILAVGLLGLLALARRRRR